MKNQQLHSLSDRLMGATVGLQMLCTDVRHAKDAAKQEAVGTTLGRFIADLQNVHTEITQPQSQETT